MKPVWKPAPVELLPLQFSSFIPLSWPLETEAPICMQKANFQTKACHLENLLDSCRFTGFPLLREAPDRSQRLQVVFSWKVLFFFCARELGFYFQVNDCKSENSTLVESSGCDFGSGCTSFRLWELTQFLPWCLPCFLIQFKERKENTCCLSNILCLV